MSIRSATRLAGLGLLLAALGGCTATSEQGVERTALALTFDNDYFAGSDNNYTNGVALTSLSGPVHKAPEDSFSRRWAEIWSFLPFFDPETQEAYVGTAIGQEIFTPDDIKLASPPLDDQPYAGIAFVDFTFAGKSPRLCNAWRVRLGVVGPASQAEDVQKAAHDLIDDDEPQGWDTQLPDEPIINLDYNVAYELTGYHQDSFGLRFVPVAGLAAGTYFTGATAGAYTELGWNLPDTVGAISPRRGIDPIGLVSAANAKQFSLSTFFGGGGFAVGHYLPLDGTVFRDSRSVESEPLVAFASTGLALRRGRLALSYLLTFFTDTFETQQDSDDFGRVTLSWSL